MKSLLLCISGAVLMLLFIEAGLRLLPVSTATRSDYYLAPRILTYPPGHCFTVSTGWDLKNPQRQCANNFGFLSERDFSHDPQAIALVGDSFVEANMLPRDRTLAAQLESLLADRPVFALGGPGSSLLDYAERALFAASRFGINTFVFVLERSDVEQAFCGSGNVHALCIDAASLHLRTQLQPAPSLFKRFARESALAQYIFSQLKFNPAQAWRSLGEKKGPPPARIATPGMSADACRVAVLAFFAQLSQIGDARIYYVIDPPREDLFAKNEESACLQELRTVAEEHGAVEIETAPSFREDLASSGLKLEVGPYDHHWNPRAVRMVAQAIAQTLSAPR